MEKRVGEEDLLSKRGLEKFVRVRRLGIKGKFKKLNFNVKESVIEDIFNFFYFKEFVKYLLI